MFNAYSPELRQDLRFRWNRLQENLRETGADALLAATNVNLLYLTGRIFMGYVHLPAEGEPLFFVRRPCGLSGANVFELRKPEQIPDLLREAGIALPRHLLLEGDDLTFNEHARLTACFPDARIGNGSTDLRQCRAVKTPYEIRIMRLTGSRHAAAVDRFASVYEPGMTDQAWSIEMFRLMLQAGGLGLFRIAGNSMEGFMGTVLAGDNGGAASPYDFALGGAGLDPSLPVGQSGVTLTEGMSVMVDIAGNFYGYLTDCTRTFAIGRLAPRAVEAHCRSIEIQQAVAAAGVPGARCEDLYALALKMAEDAGFADCFMGLAQKAKFIGHGTGLVINEQPVLGARSKETLQEGMCIALEPKFVIPGTGAVGVEDTFLVTPAGMENLTPCDPSMRVL
ncbi:MAG TPA: Xaa-Pro peptidase family protein [Kiritimatiellia bacterium]|jgi:Xaa-Pro aminopeptidase|nr:Xaa-Pro peptidase family protein [Kiritimatiellia bacterium]HOM58432.1 Xaa-Pro peptidase family protein [Kiritimatiellia bacterium]HOR97730.1 Xaa-Pro peptidase family protein [Kiritimatiellia bacterium]HPC49302.1 Xaa-Pro peptidase family protein [Kiritimatiellia bacterium]HPK37492.1 Xaa-Pro peptidase family protein [Kiritimatiellia bacterium]